MKNKLFLVPLVLSLSACTAADLRKEIGITRESPDEFLVMPRESLVIPTTAVGLPSPTKKEEGHIAASENARKAIYGEEELPKRENSAAENALLATSGAKDVDSSIRRTVDKEYKGKTGVFGTDRGGTMESVLDPFGYNSASEPIVDAKAENRRIKDAIRKGEKIDASAVKKKDPAEKEKIKTEGII